MSMQQALALARRASRLGEVPVGAILVDSKNHVLARAHNKVEAWKTPLAHAELLVLLQGQKKLGDKFLQGCRLYVTLQPCTFCWGALSLCRLDTVYFGAYAPLAPLSSQSFFDVVGGIDETACSSLLKTFFENQRRKDVDSLLC